MRPRFPKVKVCDRVENKRVVLTLRRWRAARRTRVAEQGRSRAESGTAKIESSRDIDYEDSHHSQRSALRHGAILRRLRLAHASLRNDPQTEVTVFLMADAVVFVRKGAENAGRLLQYRASSKARQRRQRHEKMRGGIVRLFRDLELITHDLTES